MEEYNSNLYIKFGYMGKNVFKVSSHCYFWLLVGFVDNKNIIEYRWLYSLSRTVFTAIWNNYYPCFFTNPILAPHSC